MHFKSAQKQYADFALLGEPGQSKDLTLELMLLADVALIGTPSVGKSSLINVVSDVKAKTAEYPFTTLVPNLGMISHKGISFSMIDVPGLIEGASSGKGLGNEFLRHILKSRIFAFCIDSSRYDTGLEEFPLLFAEIQQYLAHRHGDDLVHEIKVE
jgi:GTPase